MCKFHSKDPDNLIQHMDEEHNVPDFLPIPCLIDGCTERFESLIQQSRHKKYQHWVNGVLCMHCGKLKKDAHALKWHIKNFHADKTKLDYACDQCDHKTYSPVCYYSTVWKNEKFTLTRNIS